MNFNIMPHYQYTNSIRNQNQTHLKHMSVYKMMVQLLVLNIIYDKLLIIYIDKLLHNNQFVTSFNLNCSKQNFF